MTARARAKVIEREVKERLGWLIEPVAALDKQRHEFFRAPKTTSARLAERMGQRCAQRLSEVGEDGIAEDMLGCWLTDDEMETAFEKIGASIQKRRERLSRRYLGPEILAGLDAANTAVKNAPLALLRAPETGTAACAAYGKFLASRRLRGERRAAALWDAVGDICEVIYLPYLRSLWIMASLVKQQPPTPPPQFGTLAAQLADRLEDSSIVDAHASHVRNAIKHHHADYFVADQIIRLRNIHRGTEVWESRLVVPALETIAVDLMSAASTLDEGIALFMEMAMYEAGLFRLFIDLRLAFKARDSVAIERLGIETEQRWRDMFAEIHTLHAFGMIDGPA